MRRAVRRLAYPLTVTAALASLVTGAVLLVGHTGAGELLMQAVTRTVAALFSAF